MSELRFEAEAAAILTQRELTLTFSRSRLWEMERWLGHGSYGVTVLLRDRDPLRLRDQKRMVLKRPLRPRRNYEDFRIEIVLLTYMRGNAHHAQMIASTRNVARYRREGRLRGRRTLRRLRALFANPPTNVFKSLSIFDGPAILLEYIENGSLLKVLERAYEAEIQLPNRILWSFYFCLVRACIGLAFPVMGPEGGPEVLETIGVSREATHMIHGDIAARNIMVGERDPGVQEHRSVPSLKMIDYGLAGRTERAEDAIIENLHHSAIQMLWMISREGVDLRVVEFNGVRTLASAILPSCGGVNRYPNLDPELRDLIVDALRTDTASRPSLADMYRRTRHGAMKPPSAYPRRVLEESDYPIRVLLQQLVYDA